MVAQWLRDIGGSVDGIVDPDALKSGETAGSVVLVAECAADLDVVRAMSGGPRRPPVVAVLMEPSWPLVLDLVRTEVHAVAVLPLPGELILQVLAEARRSRPTEQPIVLLPRDMLERLGTFRARPLPHRAAPTLPLTPREQEILELLDRDFTNEEIARILVISPHTVKRHLEHLFDKLAVRSRYEAVRLAHRYGLLRTRSTDRIIPPGVGQGPESEALSFPVRARSVPAPEQWCEA
ncbi:MAG: LuxR C-terminal-related transcriptional regulator [Actinomycetia bacterium]|nr:LuxR C-terminal-related transcriptional regulator [Actinomycetes bacterium]